MASFTSRRTTMAQPEPKGAARGRSLSAWPPTLVAYREELRRAVAAIEERRRRRLRTA